MSETKMPAVEATTGGERELVAYELAFHVLPTIAEGEVPRVFESLKNAVVSEGGAVTAEEAPEHFELAYEIVKYLEGKNRTFKSAYFGWIRFQLDPQKLEAMTEHVDAHKELLRYLLIRLTKVEEAQPFMFHESIADRKVSTIGTDEADVVAEVAPEEIVVDPVEAIALEVPESGADTKEPV